MKKKLVKRLMCSVIVLMMVLYPQMNANAAEVQQNVEEESTIVDEAENSKNLRYGEREEVTVLKTEYVTKTFVPEGQLQGGYKFSSGGGLYINTSGGTSTSVSLGVSWGIVNTSVSVGTASRNAFVGGTFVEAPNKTDYFKAEMKKTFKVEYKKIDIYSYNEYVRTVYVSDAMLYSVDTYMVKV